MNSLAQSDDWFAFTIIFVLAHGIDHIYQLILETNDCGDRTNTSSYENLHLDALLLLQLTVWQNCAGARAPFLSAVAPVVHSMVALTLLSVCFADVEIVKPQ